MKAFLKMISANDNLIMIFGLVALTSIINNFTLMLKLINMLLPLNCVSCIYYLI